MQKTSAAILLLISIALNNSSQANVLDGLTIDAQENEKIIIKESNHNIKPASACINETEGTVTVPGFESTRFFINSSCQATDKPMIIFVDYFSLTDADGFVYEKIEDVIDVDRNNVRYHRRYISNQLVAHGYSTLRYDFLGTGCTNERKTIKKSNINIQSVFNPFCLREHEFLKMNPKNVTDLLHRVLINAHEIYKTKWPKDTIFLMLSANTVVVSDLLKSSVSLPPDTRYSGLGLTAAWADSIDDFKWQKVDSHIKKIETCPVSEIKICLEEFLKKIEKSDPQIAPELQDLIANFTSQDKMIKKLKQALDRYFNEKVMPELDKVINSKESFISAKGIKMNGGVVLGYNFLNKNQIKIISKKLHKIFTINSKSDSVIDYNHSYQAWKDEKIKETQFISMTDVDHDLGILKLIESNDASEIDYVIKVLVKTVDRMSNELSL